MLIKFIVLFFFNDTAATEIYTLSLHDALPISLIRARKKSLPGRCRSSQRVISPDISRSRSDDRSEEHTSELQSHVNLVCRLLLEKKKKRNHTNGKSNTVPRQKAGHASTEVARA